MQLFAKDLICCYRKHRKFDLILLDIFMKATDVSKGKIILFKDTPHTVMDYQHRTPGNKRGFVQVKMRNLLTGIQTEFKFSSDDTIELADVGNFDATYLYQDDMGFHFMNSENFEQIDLPKDVLKDNVYYLRENMTVQVNTYNDQPISINLPKTVVLTIVETQPELKGATANNSPKPATTDTGLTLNVPGFLKIGDRITVDTAEGSYLSRAE